MTPRAARRLSRARVRAPDAVRDWSPGSAGEVGGTGADSSADCRIRSVEAERLEAETAAFAGHLDREATARVSRVRAPERPVLVVAGAFGDLNRHHHTGGACRRGHLRRGDAHALQRDVPTLLLAGLQLAGQLRAASARLG